jgi:hypothetical protein
MTDLETYSKRSWPDYDDLRLLTERVNEIAYQTTSLTEAVAVAMFSDTTPVHPSCQHQIQQWQQIAEERNRSISPITDSDVAQGTGLRGGSETDIGMADTPAP